MATYSSVDCWEIRDTATQQIGNEGTTASVELGCTWANRFSLASDLMANRRVWPYTVGTGAPRVSNITSIRGFGESTVQPASSDQLFDWDEARLEVEYAPLAGTVGSEDYDLAIETLEGEAAGVRLSDNGFYWPTGGTGPSGTTPIEPGEAPVKEFYPARLVREYIGIAAIPPAALDLVGTVNQAAYTSTILGYTFPAETLRLNYPFATRTIRASGASGWNLQLSMTYVKQGHNKFWRQNKQSVAGFTGDWEVLNVIDPDDLFKEYRNYPLADFTPLLR